MTRDDLKGVTVYDTPRMSSKVFVAGRLHVAGLFPQVAAYNALALSVLALVVASLAFGLHFMCS